MVNRVYYTSSDCSHWNNDFPLIKETEVQAELEKTVNPEIIFKLPTFYLPDYEKFTDDAGNIFEGTFKDGDLTQGQITFTDGRKWEGTFKDFCLNGYGRMLHANGVVDKQGEFTMNSLNGYGRVFLEDGTVCKGQFRNDLLHGFGKMITPDGKIHEGDFKKGCFISGKTTHADKKVTYTDKRLNINPRDSYLTRLNQTSRIHGKTPEKALVVVGNSSRLFRNGYGKVKGNQVNAPLDKDTIVEGTFHNGDLSHGQITFSNGRVWEGTFKDRVDPRMVWYSFNGFLRTLHANGKVDRQGEFFVGKLDGHGQRNFEDGTVWKGEFDVNLLHGYGRIISADGTIREGEFQFGEFKYGKIIHPDGKVVYRKTELILPESLLTALESVLPNKQEKRIYNGRIEQGEFEGDELRRGTITFPDGNLIMEGEFKNHRLHGQGKLTDKRGGTYIGTFQDGVLNGPGKLIWYGGSRVSEGEFKNGMLNGPGKETFSNNRLLWLEWVGQFKDGELNGPGKVIFADGTVWEQDFQCDLNGPGKKIFGDGRIGEGEFKNGMLNGPGKLTTSEKVVLEGEFKDNMLNGQGTMTFPDGLIRKGEFEYSRLHGYGKIISDGGPICEGVFNEGKLISGTVTYTYSKEGPVVINVVNSITEGDMELKKILKS